jgi:hypothetical protein
VLPTAIAAAVSSEPAMPARSAAAILLGALTAKVPTRIAGHMRKPRQSTAASAKPAGGQIGMALR